MEITKETSEQRIGRQGKNALISSPGFCEKSELLAKIKLKKDKLNPIKRTWGQVHGHDRE
jgi:hypothetical protein